MTEPKKSCAGMRAGILSALGGILSAMSFVVDAQGYVGMSDPPASATSYLWCALAVCFGLLFFHVYRRVKVRLSALQAVFGLLFGVVNALGVMLFSYDSWDALRSPAQLLMTLARAVGQSLPMMAGFAWLSHVLEGGALTRKGALEEAGEGRIAGVARFFCAHESLCLTLLFALCWLPYVLVYYPGTVCWDLGEMAEQFFGVEPMNTWHGVFLTWVFGGCVQLGRLLGGDHLGVVLYALIQTALLAWMAAQVMVFLRSSGLNRAFRLMVLAFFAVTPIWGGYAQFVSKDTLYTAVLTLFALRAAQVLLMREADQPFKGIRLPLELFVWGLLACLMRLNGVYVILPSAVMLIVFGAKGRGRIGLTAALSGAVAAALIFSNVLVPALGIVDASSSGIYSVCFQQSARVLRDHGDSVTPEEYAAIDEALDAAQLADLYEPWISDPVKYTFRYFGQGAEAEKAAIAKYRSVWLSMLPKYPLTYAESFFAGNVSYYCFTPKIEGETYNNQAGNRLVFETYIDQMGDDPRLVHVTQPVPERIRTLVAMFARGWRHIPLLSLSYCCAAYTWTLVGAALSLTRQRRWRLLCAFVPALMSLAVCMLSPVNDYFRYFLPIAAMAPILAGLCAGKEKADQENPSLER
ncbi:MAG: hypothetical protein E7319_01535 [Clostridiales bacterium]|nr:hypothetical protein [Clostridiales bacterium]